VGAVLSSLQHRILEAGAIGLLALFIELRCAPCSAQLAIEKVPSLLSPHFTSAMMGKT